MTKQIAAKAILNAKIHAPKAGMRSSADHCIATAEECIAEDKYQLAFDWAVRSLGYSINVFKAREIAIFGAPLPEGDIPVCHD